MNRVRDAIDEMIEESYLLGLTDEEIWNDLTLFLSCCERVIKREVKDKETINLLEKKLSSVRVSTLIKNKFDPNESKGTLKEDGTLKSAHEVLAERVSLNKRRILQAIGKCDPKFVSMIESERYRSSPQPGPSKRKRGRYTGGVKLWVYKVIYIAGVVALFLLIYLILIQLWR